MHTSASHKINCNAKMEYLNEMEYLNKMKKVSQL